MTARAEAVLFDKDGTLFDFDATWSVWAGQVIQTLAGRYCVAPAQLAQAARYDLAAKAFYPDSLFIAGTNAEAAEAVSAAVPNLTVAQIEAVFEEEAAQAPLVEAAPLAPLLAQLSVMELFLGVMTNDSEAGARAHLRAAGVEGAFDFIAGYDSGFGAKPAPRPLLAFAHHVGVPAARCVMVGDSRHDLQAGRAAGMQTVAVLTGPASAQDLQPLADVVLPDISHLPKWLARSG